MSNKNVNIPSPAPVRYKKKKAFFSDKEIIFRSDGRARVFNISSRTQLVALCMLVLVVAFSLYSYLMYNHSGKVISRKDNEILATKDAYVKLISDVAILNKNIETIVHSQNKPDPAEIEEYKKQAALLSERIKDVVEDKDWISSEQMSEKMSLSEVVLQRDLLISEREELKRQIVNMEESIDDLKTAEMEVYDKISSVTSKELDKIKATLSAINVPLKKKGLYYNALSNKKSSGKGGPYIPVHNQNSKDAKINKQITVIFENINDLEYYKEIMNYIPAGKPVWSYWVSSQFGTRPDPFHAKEARHKGIDLASRTGNKVKTMAKGKVTRAEFAGAYGNLVELDHGNGFKTRYAHLHKIYVKKGDNVNIDGTIGEVGSTGRSTGPHLHYEIIYRGVNVDPMPFIKAKAS